MASDDHPALTQLKAILPAWRIYECDRLSRQAVVAHSLGQRLLFRQEPGSEPYSRRVVLLVGQILAHPKVRLTPEQREWLALLQHRFTY